MSTIIVNPASDMVIPDAKYVSDPPIAEILNNIVVDPANDMIISGVPYIVQNPVVEISDHVIVNPADDMITNSYLLVYVVDPPVALNAYVKNVDWPTKDDETPLPEGPQPYFISQAARYVNFTATPRIGNRPLTVEFSAIIPPYGSVIGWDFGDGQTAGALSSVFHTYEQEGEYEVNLTAEIYGVQYIGIKKFYVIVLAENRFPDPVYEDVKGTIFKKTFLIPPLP